MSVEEVLRRRVRKRVLLGDVERGLKPRGPRGSRVPKLQRAPHRDRGCSGEAGWGRARGASGSAFGNGRFSEPGHSLGCVSSAVVVFHEAMMCTVCFGCVEEQFSV